MIRIDGSFGEGGGQILRTSLTLSLITGEPFEMSNIRSGRSRPGLLRQHLTAVNASAEISGAKVNGNTIGSRELGFAPGPVRPGDYHFAIGSAGSATLVFQTLLPALATAKGSSSIQVEGGTHNPFAPTFDFLARAYLPLVHRMGPRVLAILDKAGFYPAGGGRLSAVIEPSPFSGLELVERGETKSCRARAVVAHLPAKIAERELKEVAQHLPWDESCLEVEVCETSAGPGNVLSLEVESGNVCEVFTGFGRQGIRAQKVAREAVKQAADYLASGVPVGRYLADQLLVPLALAGEGRYRTLSPSGHTKTNIDVIQRFLDVNIRVEECGNRIVEIAVQRA